MTAREVGEASHAQFHGFEVFVVGHRLLGQSVALGQAAGALRLNRVLDSKITHFPTQFMTAARRQRDHRILPGLLGI